MLILANKLSADGALCSSITANSECLRQSLSLSMFSPISKYKIERFKSILASDNWPFPSVTHRTDLIWRESVYSPVSHRYTSRLWIHARRHNFLFYFVLMCLSSSLSHSFLRLTSFKNNPSLLRGRRAKMTSREGDRESVV
jgi:hypothetical protein